MNQPMSSNEVYRTLAKTLLPYFGLAYKKVKMLFLPLNKGRLVEQGTHDESIKQNGEYAKMYLAQSKWYQDNGAQDLLLY